jgi:cytosine/adenosine deaminase-related metal-dependent hydrolase
VDRAVHLLEKQLRKTERDLAVHFVVRAYTDAERELVEERETPVNLVWGWLPFDWQEGGGGPLRSHGDLDDRARRLAERIGKRIAEDPAIIARAIEWIDQREKEEPDPAKRDLEEWRSVLTTLSPRQVEALLVEESERADRLRQSLPFVDVLTSEDRAAVFRDVA